MNEMQVRHFRRSLILPALVEVPLAVMAALLVISAKPEELWMLLTGIAVALPLLYLATVQAVWGVGPIGWILMQGFRKPLAGIGLIFTLDLDGIIWFLTVKLGLAILGVLLSFFIWIFCIGFAMVIAPFSFPFVLMYIKRNPDEMMFGG